MDLKDFSKESSATSFWGVKPSLWVSGRGCSGQRLSGEFLQFLVLVMDPFGQESGSVSEADSLPPLSISFLCIYSFVPVPSSMQSNSYKVSTNKQACWGIPFPQTYVELLLKKEPTFLKSLQVERSRNQHELKFSLKSSGRRLGQWIGCPLGDHKVGSDCREPWMSGREFVAMLLSTTGKKCTFMNKEGM